MQRTVALTGATGFIGGAVMRALVAADWSVRILVRSPRKARSLPGLTRQVVGSLEDLDSLRRLVGGVHALVHCAGAVRGVTRAQFDAVNVAGVARVVEAVSEQASPPRILMISSLAAREPGLSAYAASKRKGEEVLLQQGHGLVWTALRPPAVYGPGDRELLPLFRWMGRGIAPVAGRADSRFSMLHVDDLAAAVLMWLNREPCELGVFELHDGRVGGYSWQEVIGTASRLCRRRVLSVPVPLAVLQPVAVANWLAGLCCGYAPMLTPGKLRELGHRNWVCDNTAFCRATGWTPTIGLEDGLRRLSGWCASKGAQTGTGPDGRRQAQGSRRN